VPLGEVGLLMNARLNIIGTGYVGLVTGLCLAHRLGKKVAFYDSNETRINELKNGILPIFEPGLDEVFTDVRKRGLCEFHCALPKAPPEISTINFICVGTPSMASGEADLSQIDSASNSLLSLLKKSTKQHTVVVKSTVPPGTTAGLASRIFAGQSNIGIAMVPEFLREGCAIEDALNPDRFIIGSISPIAIKSLKALFGSFAKCPVLVTSSNEAELSKYANNSLLALLISYANEISMVSESLGDVDPHKVIDNVLLDKRWVTKSGETPAIASYLRPGCGFGGSCFPKDVAALAHLVRSRNIKAPLIKGVLETNQRIREMMAKKIEELFPKGLKKEKISILGLSFKPDTDDIRESPSLYLIEHFKKVANQIVIHDYEAKWPAKAKSDKHVIFTRDIKEALEDSSCVALVTSWRQYKSLPESKLKKWMKRPLVVDGRGFWRDRKFSSIEYHVLGLRPDERD
jgi:UDPglucose 6-dehydrogenase